MPGEVIRVPSRAGSATQRRQSLIVDIDRAEASLIALAVVLSVGFGLRLIAAFSLTPHVDEAASILAAHVVSEQFMPILPSGNVYFQGFTQSLILSPLAWIGLADLDDLVAMRLVSVVAGTASIAVSYRLGLFVTGHRVASLAVALLVAVDPLSVQWSGHVRMYAFLQLLAFLIAWVWIGLMHEPVTGGRAVYGVVLGWLAVFTHSGASLLVVSVIVAVGLSKGRTVIYQYRLLAAMGALAMAPIKLLVLNRLLGPPEVRATGASGKEGVTFVGDSLIRPFGRFLDGSLPQQLSAMESRSAQLWLFPGLLVAIVSLLGMVLLLTHLPCGLTRATVWYVNVTFWFTSIAFVFLTDSLAGRYLLHVYSVGYLLVPLIAVAIAERMAFLARQEHRRIPMLGALSIVVIVAALLFDRTMWRLDNPVVNADYHAAMSYVAGHYNPGQPVIVALPPVAYLALGAGNLGDLYFLAGPAGEPRAEEYSRVTEDGRRIDYWVGVETIVSAEALRDLLLEHPNALIVVDSYRLSAEGAYRGDIEEVIRGMTTSIFQGPGGVYVMKVHPAFSGAQTDIP